MREHFIAFIWKHRLYNTTGLTTTSGLPIVIENCGYAHIHAGPDFQEASIRIGDLQWQGHVEIHVQSSDWIGHRHHEDNAYKNVILHVVWEENMKIRDAHGLPIPCLELKGRVPLHFIQNYHRLRHTKTWIPCASSLQRIRSITQTMVLEKAAFERLEEKSRSILARLKEVKGNWQQVTFEWLCRGWGFHINGSAFEFMAQLTPIEILLKNVFDQQRVEAILLGQMGLLSEQDPYSTALSREYFFLSMKYDLSTAAHGIARFLRTRPSNFPTLRLAQLAAVLYRHPYILDKLRSCASPSVWHDWVGIPPSEYWQRHTKCGTPSKKNMGGMGRQSSFLLFINVVLPLRFALAQKQENPTEQGAILDLLGSIKPENNVITRRWKDHGGLLLSAAQSQGVFHLYETKCKKMGCLSCGIGHDLLQFPSPAN